MASMAEGVSEDDFTASGVGGDTTAVLEALRLRLLDLTLLNRVLSFRPAGPRVVRVIDELPDQLHARLDDGAELELLPVPLPAKDHEHHAGATSTKKPERRATATLHAAATGLATDFDLPRSPAKSAKAAPAKHRDAAIQTVLFPDDLEADLRTLAAEARSAIEEKGSNVLYLVFGFLEWFEDRASEKALHAPLVMMPVTLRRGEPDRKTGAYRFFLAANEEDVIANVSLQEKLRRDFALTLPEIEEDESPETYFDRLARTVELPERWKIRPQVALGLLSFTKLFMYRDLDPASWPAGDGPADHPLVAELFRGGATGAEYAREYDFESPDGPKAVPPIVLDADSSQHSAIVDAMQGRTLVVEGPPGTGKSQTIANLVAAAMAQGKSVLFVAEKLTALQVVSRRLEDIGLGAFCLELHSDRTQKSRLMDDLRRRIEQRGSFRAPPQLSERLQLLHAAREELNAYAARMRAPVGALGWTAHEVLWGHARRRVEIDPDAWRDVTLDVTGLTHARLEALRAAALRFEGALDEVGVPSEHAFAGVGAVDADAVLGALVPLSAAQATLTSAIAALGAKLPGPLPADEAGYAALTARVYRLEKAAIGVRREALPALATREAREALATWAADAEQWRARASRIRGSLPDEMAAAQLAAAEAELAAFAPAARIGTVVRLGRMALGLHATLERAGRMVTLLADFLGDPDVPRTLDAVTTVSELFALLSAASPEVLAARAAPDVVEACVRTGTELQRERAQLAQSFDLGLLPADPRVLEAHAATAATAGVLSFFSAEHREAKRQYALLYRGTFDGAQMTHGLRALASFQRRTHDFVTNPDYARVLGPLFRGLDTSFGALAAAKEWQARATEWAARHHRVSAKLGAIVTAPVERLRTLLDARRSVDLDLANLRAQVDELAAMTTDGASERPLPELHLLVDELVNRSTPIAHLVETVRVAESSTIGELLRLATDARTLTADRARLATAPAGGWELATADLAEVTRTLKLANELGAEPPLAIAVDELAATHALLVAVNEAQLAADLAQVAFGQTAATTERWSPERTRRANDAKDTLPAWLAYRAARAALVAAGSETFAATAERVRTRLSLAAEHAVYAALARSVLDGGLRDHDGAAHTLLRARYRELDEEVMKLQRAQLASQIDEREVPAGVTGASVKQRTELALVDHELGKKRAHIPIRQLVSRAGGALRALKPCFMMSPRSVAQYLSAGTHRFDLVIMDEASQLRPEDAIGAIARGKQAVIVGDSKQLPPTSFFRTQGTDEEEEELVVETKESILDLAKGAFKAVRQLRWHYRSRHESLIAFSNDRYYDGSLVVFPSPVATSPHLGVKHVAVDDGLCIDGVNDLEAKAIVDAVVTQLRERPTESFGVVAMNVKQRERIAELLDAALKEEPELRRAFDATGSDAPFVKNLESVQGDERDVVFLSVTYGRSEPGGKVARTFGPLNGTSGWRRLNVLFTRARRRVVVFASFAPEDLGDEATLSRGAADLRAYLVFARSGSYTSRTTTSLGSDLTQTLGRALDPAVTVPHVGLAGYFVDLAVKAEDGAYALGIEADGATYTGAFSARDRDRLRPQVLEGLGWKLHRVWSTDWTRDPAGQARKLVDAAKT